MYFYLFYFQLQLLNENKLSQKEPLVSSCQPVNYIFTQFGFLKKIKNKKYSL